MDIYLVIIIVLITLFCGVGLGVALVSARNHVRAIRQQITDLSAKVDTLSESRKTRNPYRTNEALEDAIAVALDVLQQSTAERAYEAQRIHQLKTILGQARSNPDGYDPEHPNGKTRGHFDY